MGDQIPKVPETIVEAMAQVMDKRVMLETLESLSTDIFVELVPHYRREKTAEWRKEGLIGAFDTVESYVAKQAISFAKALMIELDREAEDILGVREEVIEAEDPRV